MFRAIPSKELIIGQKIIVPVSLNSKHFSTEKMQSLLSLLEKHNATLLIADSLQKHNCGCEKKALKLGNSFLEKCARLLKTAVQINTFDKWLQYKNDNVLKIVRWDMWANIKKNELWEANELIEKDLQKENDLYQSIVSVANELVEKSMLNIKSKANSQDEIDTIVNRTRNSSIQYQKEEIKFLFSFSEFEVHLYPEINASQNLAFAKYSKDFKLPEKVSFTIEPNINLLFFPDKKQTSHCKSLSLAGRTLALHFQAFITSPEVNLDEKKALIDLLNAQLEKAFDKNTIDNDSEMHNIVKLHFNH